MRFHFRRGSSPNEAPELIATLRTMFGAKAAEIISLNGFRYTASEKAFGLSATVNNHLHKGVDASSLPLCEAEPQQHNNII